MKVTVGLLQMSCSASPEANLKKALSLIDQAAKKGSQIISTQELFSSLYFCQERNDEFFKLAQEIPNAVTEALCIKARQWGVVLIASVFEKAGLDYFNTALVIDGDGKIAGTYRKIHIPDDPKHHFDEAYYFKPGDLPLKAVQTKFGKIGVLVCWDQWYPEPARLLAADGAEVIFYPTAIGWNDHEISQPVGKNEMEAWITIQRSHAIANGVFVAATNRIGKESFITFWGSSFVADPIGEILKKASADKEEILMVNCDLDRIPEVRQSWPFLKCRRY